ncbi:Fructoselysine-6-P-deglycase FrlB with duplicated sugar isomerase (SIS) domain [Streptomyces zhaozhouensis]|uniref:Fructoselysine-6-P-deglycase FrlB with duplicated sugar isomerase (SIS) domain n=1 Tax=Streptomyces zhaozhouensis TaxID=1300267 RepID=A0A286E536_9ACTN|nr:SIS domain-containing protein [Streptomyces zhaozhouensis]SOD66015.1 Fructoselysine-6-P-deglycase FrlB with duplicated sugar isomerase (SIS) domain [Streptomyces zhaozhouensis]
MTVAGSLTSSEIAAQPAAWRRAIAEARAAREGALADALPRPGERVAVTGCGTSWFVALAYAALREAAGEGETDAFAASEFPVHRAYDRVVAISRSGTTTEVADLLVALRARHPRTPLLALTADGETPVGRAADRAAVLDWADERSVVQTVFATTALTFLRAGLTTVGEGPAAASVADAEAALASPLPDAALAAGQWTFLGAGWAYGLAQEAALKMREAAGGWTEAYPSMEYRHGPIAIAGAGRVVWLFTPAPEGVAERVRSAGATLWGPAPGDPLASLVVAQRLAVAVAGARGLDPDRPRGLTRSVILR